MTAARPRVLLVDDQVEVIHGLRRVLARLAPAFDFEPSGSGADALARLEQAPWAVVVSDLRMPEMSGLELLRQVARRAPTTARVLLSGTFDVDSATAALPIAHRFLGKPCDARTLAALCGELHRLAPAVAATGVGAIVALAITTDALTRARAASDRVALAGAVRDQPALIAAMVHALGSQFLGDRCAPITLEQALASAGPAGVARLLGSGALIAVDGDAAIPVRDHAARGRARAEQVVRAGGTATDALAALLATVDQLGTDDGSRWPGLRAGGGAAALLGLWGASDRLVDQVGALAAGARD